MAVLTKKRTGGIFHPDPAMQNIELYAGAHFNQWIGPILDKEKYQDADEVMDAVERVFQSHNLVKECVDRHVDSLIGNPPIYFFTDLEGNRKNDEASNEADIYMQRILNNWDTQATETETDLDDAFDPHPIVRALTLLLLTGTAYLRLWTPDIFANSPNPAQRVALHCPSNDAIVIERHTGGFMKAVKYRYVDEGIELTEYQFIDPLTNETVFQTLDTQGNLIGDEIRINLGGRFTVFEFRRSFLVSESIRRKQNGLNYALTMLLRNISFGGFPWLLVLGALPPGRWEQDETTGREEYIEEGGIEVGPGEATFVTGTPEYDADGKITGYSRPSVFAKDPVSVQTFIDTVNTLTALIYREFGQQHIISDNKSQQVALVLQYIRDDNRRALKKDASRIAIVFKKLFLTAVLLATDEPERFLNLDISVQIQPSLNSPTGDDMQQTRENFKAGLLSRPTAMSRIGVEDTDAEEELIKKMKREDAAANKPVTPPANPPAETPPAQENGAGDSIPAPVQASENLP